MVWRASNITFKLINRNSHKVYEKSLREKAIQIGGIQND